MRLEDFGWCDFFAQNFRQFVADGLTPARVTAQHGKTYKLNDGAHELLAETAGRLRYHADSPADLPAVGDWVATEVRADEGRATIHAVLPRRTAFSRKVSGRRQDEQVVAANLDRVFLITGLDGDFNLRRIERYLAMAWESGAAPVVVLNKADLCADIPGVLAAAEAVAIGTPIHAISALTGDGLDSLDLYLVPGQTIALLGSSGVGKSTLVNRLLGEELLATQPVREHDSRGRHTTTHRQLLALPGGALLVDTPGMRELQLWVADDGVATAFDDVESLAPACRFRDCRHQQEPGCAVQQAVADGQLDAERVESYHKLQRELAYLDRKDDVLAQIEENRRWRAIHKAQRKLNKG